MVNILIFSKNEELKADLTNQLSRFVSDANFTNISPDVVICDGDDKSISKFRSEHTSVPIVYLSLSDDNQNDALNIFFKKPVRLMHLLDVVRSANNHLDNSAEGNLTFNNYILYPNKREIEDLGSGKIIKLTEKEVSIIKYLYKNASEFVSKSDLQKNVWQYNEDVTTHTIETHIYRLRQKVEQDNGRRLIITDSGGYKLKTDEDA